MKLLIPNDTYKSVVMAHCFAFSIFCFIILFYSCHKEDPNGYKMSVKNFSEQSAKENIYQLSLAQEMGLPKNDVELVSLALKRQLSSKQYIMQLIAATSDTNLSLLVIDEDDKDKLSILRNLSGAEYRSRLIKMAMDSDQELIALHVKATSNNGIKDASIREWASSKLPMLMDKLKEVQQLK